MWLHALHFLEVVFFFVRYHHLFVDRSRTGFCIPLRWFLKLRTWLWLLKCETMIRLLNSRSWKAGKQNHLMTLCVLGLGGFFRCTLAWCLIEIRFSSLIQIDLLDFVCTFYKSLDLLQVLSCMKITRYWLYLEFSIHPLDTLQWYYSLSLRVDILLKLFLHLQNPFQSSVTAYFKLPYYIVLNSPE